MKVLINNYHNYSRKIVMISRFHYARGSGFLFETVVSTVIGERNLTTGLTKFVLHAGIYHFLSFSCHSTVLFGLFWTAISSMHSSPVWLTVFAWLSAAACSFKFRTSGFHISASKFSPLSLVEIPLTLIANLSLDSDVQYHCLVRLDDQDFKFIVLNSYELFFVCQLFVIYERTVRYSSVRRSPETVPFSVFRV